jgi:hypothetical protein
MNGRHWSFCNDTRNDPCGCFFVLPGGSLVQGITCKDKHITGIAIAGIGVHGRIPETFGRGLQQVTSILLEEAKIIGTITPGFFTMQKLTDLDCSGATFSGTIPTGFAKMKSLGTLWLGGGSLTGTIPTELALMDSLRFLDLSENNLNGTIPSEFAHMTALTAINLDQNQLTGLVPELNFGRFTDDCCLDNTTCKGTPHRSNIFTCPLP